MQFKKFRLLEGITSLWTDFTVMLSLPIPMACICWCYKFLFLLPLWKLFNNCTWSLNTISTIFSHRYACLTEKHYLNIMFYVFVLNFFASTILNWYPTCIPWFHVMLPLQVLLRSFVRDKDYLAYTSSRNSKF